MKAVGSGVLRGIGWQAGNARRRVAWWGRIAGRRAEDCVGQSGRGSGEKRGRAVRTWARAAAGGRAADARANGRRSEDRDDRGRRRERGKVKIGKRLMTSLLRTPRPGNGALAELGPLPATRARPDAPGVLSAATLCPLRSSLSHARQGV